MNTPHDPEAEASVIASCASAPVRSSPAIAKLGPENFLVPKHRAVWGALKDLWSKGLEIDLLTLKANLESRRGLEAAGGVIGLSELLSSSEVGRPEILADRLLELWRRREYIKLGASVAREAGDLGANESDLAAKLTTGMCAIQAGQALRRRSGLEILHKLEAMEPFNGDGHSAPEPKITFNLDPLDSNLERAPGQVILVAARPGAGKTALMVQGFAETVVSGQKALFISLELDEGELQARVASYLTNTPQRTLRQGYYNETCIRRGQAYQEALERAHLVCVPSGTPWTVLEAEIRAAVIQEGVSSVWLDYFTLIGKPTGNKGQTDASLWGELSTRIRSVAQTLKVPFVLASQLNRGTTEYEEPGPTDLRETGQLEQDAHAIILLWRVKAGALETPAGKIAKNRGGAKVPKTMLECDWPTNRWSVCVQETNPSRGY